MSALTSALNPRQSDAAENFAAVLAGARERGDDVRGKLLACVATNLRKRGEFTLAQLIQRAADCYEGKA